MFEGLFQPTHLVIVLGLVLLFFGPKKLPDLGKSLGEALREFKQGLNEVKNPNQREFAEKSQPSTSDTAHR